MGRLSALEDACLAALTAGVRARFAGRTTRIVLFGSRARGEGRDDSDLDVLVEIEGLTRAERGEVIDLADEVSVAHHLVISPLVVAPHRLDATLDAAIARDGVAL